MRRLVPDFILLQVSSGKMAGKIRAVSLFVDISGFSAVTDALLPYGQPGAEVLAGVLRNTFEPLVSHVYEQGGFISSFGGDGFTALFPIQVDDPAASDQNAERDALTAAWRIRQWIAANGDHDTSYGRFAFTAKMGGAYGEVSWGIVSAEARAAFYFQGPAIEGCAAAGHQARPGDIILDSQLFDRVGDWVSAEQVNGYHRLIFVHGQLRPARPPSLRHVDEAHIGQFYPLELVRSSASGEFRQVVNLFVNLPTVRTEAQLAIFMRSVFELQDRYGGLLGRLDFGDKGSYLFLFWGAPLAYENDIERALNFILDLRTRTSIPIKAGLTYRIAHTGFIGSKLREEYTAYGWGVNLAARLMTSAPGDEIWVDRDVAQRVKDNYVLEYEGEQKFKGFSEQQMVYALIERREREELFYEGRLIGRRKELQKLADFISPIFAGQYAGMLVIRGDPGIGKSRLVHEFQGSDLFESNDVLWAICQSDEILRESFNPFRYWLKRTCGVSDTQIESRNKRSFNRRLGMLIASASEPELAAELDRTRSFLGALVGLRWPDSLYEQVEGQQRYDNTYSALSAFLRAESLQRPVILLLEDVHWLDADSKNLLARLSRSLARKDNRATPLAILATTRVEGGELSLDGLIYRQIDLHPLDRDNLAELAEIQLGDPAERSLLDVLEQRAEGNPFFAEQLLHNLKEREMLRRTAGHWEVVDPQPPSLPADVRAVLVARLDRLAREVREVVQTAAVLGREFELWLLKQMLDGDPSLPEKVNQAEEAGIWSALGESRYIFRHALLREAAYGMQLQTRRRTLHAMAFQALERFHAGGLLEHGGEMPAAEDIESQRPGTVRSFGELAYHAEQAGLAKEAYHTLQLAGDASREAFQNSQAVDYYTRAMAAAGQLNLDPPWELLRHRGQAFDVLGDFDAALADYEAALKRAQDLSDLRAAWQLLLELGLLWASRNYERTGAYCREALELARTLDETAAVAHSLNRLGNWHLNNGQLGEARRQHQEALALFQELGDRPGIAVTLDLLGQTLILLGNAGQSRTYYEAAIPILREVGDRQTLISSLTNLSLLRLNPEINEEAIRLARQIGWPAGEAYSRVMQGTMNIQLGQIKEALTWLHSGLALAKEIGHRQWQGWAQLYLAWLYLELLSVEEPYALLESVIDLARSINSNYLLTSAKSALIQIAILETDLDKADSLLKAVPGTEVFNYIGPLEVIQLELALLRGESERAAQLAAEFAQKTRNDLQTTAGFAFGQLRHLRLSSEALVRVGRLDEAEQLLSLAQEMQKEQGLAIEGWRLRRSFALFYRAAARPEEAAEAFAEARAMVIAMAETIPEEVIRERFVSRALASIDLDANM